MSLTDELANWVLRINNLCNEKDAEIERLRAVLQCAPRPGIFPFVASYAHWYDIERASALEQARKG